MSLIDLGQHLVGDARETALGVAHRRGAVAVERAEVAGAVDQGIAQRERLRHADERLVERHVAVRVVAAHHVANHLRALAVLDVGGQVLLPHRVEDAALHRLEAVAHVGQRPRGDDRQRVVQVAALRRLVQRDTLCSTWRRWCRLEAAAVGRLIVGTSNRDGEFLRDLFKAQQRKSKGKRQRAKVRFPSPKPQVKVSRPRHILKYLCLHL